MSSIPKGNPRDVRRRFIGVGDVWRSDSTGTGRFFLFWVPVWTWHFTHSTWLAD